MNAFDRDHFTIRHNGGMGFIPLLVGAAASIGSGLLQQRQQKKAAANAAKQTKKLAKEQAAEAERAAKAQLAARQPKSKLPSWVLPVAIGSGVLLLGLGGIFLFRKRKK